MTEQEKKEVLARLAARDVATLTALGIQATANEDILQAIGRLVDELGIEARKANQVYQAILSHLQSDDVQLTINFNAEKFFGEMPKGSKFLSAFDPGSNRPLDQVYMRTRNTIEEGLFNYSMENQDNISSKTKITKDTLNKIAQRIVNFGKYGVNDFVPDVRPKYGALNFAKLRYGAAGGQGYGCSFAVLKDYVKHNCTFYPRDSFKTGNKSDKPSPHAATFFDLQRLIRYMSKEMLVALYEVAINKKDYNKENGSGMIPGVKEEYYIEAQLHGEVRFDRDVKEIFISNNDLFLIEQFTPAKAMNIKHVFTNFGGKFGIKITEIS
jgi:hypothetical protein